ncbi:acetate/propionate family kinase [Actinokineospora inagensis]|uniref:acetate/propionate family kinase n=1 Tax=Actinokineospora inagensis TaxID=103730 RepID=UPI00047D5C69|nr:acetate/propionate family kinase [Actinokineospora inagensis]
MDVELTVRVLVVNAGSSSLKLRLLGADDAVEATADVSDTDDIAATLRSWPRPDAVGHRVVHGGAEFTSPVLVDARVKAALHDLVELAPLHQPKSLAGLDAVQDVLPDVPAVACFDTAFHSTIPSYASTYALPSAWRERYAIRRYGFHGLSHAYCAKKAGAYGSRVVSCHLGAGASVTAIVDGKSVDTTMGFTPLEGLVMATRSGSVDPGLVLWLAERMPIDEVTNALEKESGLLGLAGTADMREIEAALDDDPRARLAFDVYIHRLAGCVAAMTTAAGGLDVLAFTGGVGENSAAVRTAVAARLDHLGVRVTGAAEFDITAPGAPVRTLVVPSREDLEIAAGVRTVHLGHR